MRTVLAYPGTMAHAQHAALALAERGALDAFVTTFAFRPEGLLATTLARLPCPPTRALARQLARRSVEQVPPHLIRSHPAWEIARTAAGRSGVGAVLTDLVWDRMSHSFDALVARRYVPRVQAVHAFEYTALETFRRATGEGIAKVLHLPSLDSARLEAIQRRETGQWPDLAGRHDASFERRFAARYARRQQEIALADVIIANSALTARSHIAAGADAAKTVVVALAAPPPIAGIRIDRAARHAPLHVVFAGAFTLGKGAHHLLDAWRRLDAGSAAQLQIYGRQGLPARMLERARPHGVVFHGAVPRPALFAAFEQADVLVFPTLSDGFGMVVAEAMAHGLPVITTDQAGASDLVTADNGIVVPAADPRALADALRWCLDNRGPLQEMRFHALAAARRRQWPDYRADLITALETGLRRTGYHPHFRHPD